MTNFRIEIKTSKWKQLNIPLRLKIHLKFIQFLTLLVSLREGNTRIEMKEKKPQAMNLNLLNWSKINLG